MKKPRSLIWVAFIVLLQACTLAQLAWNNAGWLALRQLDHYFDLSRDQEKLWRPRVTALVTHLQEEAGPDLVAFLRRIQGAILAGLTEEKVASLFHEWDEFRVRHFSPVTAEAAEFLAGLDESNAARLRKRFSDSQKRAEEVLALNDEDYFKHRAARARERVESLYGRMTAAEGSSVASLLVRSRQAERDHLTQTQETRRSLLALVGSTLPQDEIRGRLDQWLRDPAAMRQTERSRLLYAEERRAWIKNIVAVDRIMTPEQRRYFAGKLEGWTKDLLGSLKEAKR